MDSVAALRHAAIYNLGYKNVRKILANSYGTGSLNKSQYDYCKRWLSGLRNEGKNYASEEQPLLELDSLVEKFIENRRIKSH